MVNRKLLKDILEALKTHPVVFINGPRQAGKSTLVQNLAETVYPATYVTLDNTTQLAAASTSAETFLSNRQGPLIVDEVQMAPEDFFRTLKSIVDKKRHQNKEQSYGQYLLTGSANIMALPKLSDPLVGRMSIKTLYPFSASEALGTQGSFLGQLFSNTFSPPVMSFSLNECIKKATFPEISGQHQQICAQWLENYLATLLQRDVRQISELEKIGYLPILLRALATRSASLINDADLSRDVGLNPVTTKTYRNILKAMFLCFDIPPWYRNIGKRLVKASKGYITDTLLLCHLLDRDIDSLQLQKPELYGHIAENFVATELLKLLSFSQRRAQLHHFRTSDNKEVDFVLERPDGTLAAIEVKTSDKVKAADIQGLKTLEQLTGKDFLSGIVLYNGEDIVSFGERVHAVPFAALWQ